MATVTKTISVKVFEPTKTKTEALQDLLNISAELSRFYVATMEDKGTYSKKALHTETYNIVKEQFNGIPTSLIQTIRDKSIETYKSYKAILKNGKKTSLPDFKHSVVRFDNRTFTLHKTDTISLSRQIVNTAKEHNAVIQMEDLSNIRENIKYSRKLNKQLHNWNFYQLQTFIEYKAIAEGLKVTYIKPEYTSQRCNVCGHTEKGNRPNQSAFKCKSCGYQVNADYNASINISKYSVVG